MRQLFILIVAVAAGYLAYTYYQEYTGASGEAQLEASSADGQTPSRGERSEAAPAFQSKIDIPPGPPGEKRLAPAGIFYMLQRVSAETATGVRALVPGEQVRLLKRTGNILKVTDSSGSIEFEVKESQVTNDLDEAQKAERMDFETRPRRR